MADRLRLANGDHRMNAIAVALGICLPLEDDGGGSFTNGTSAGLAHQVPHVTGQVHGPDQGQVDLATLQRSHGDFHRTEPGRFLAGESKARPTQLELAGNPAGRDARQRSHGAIGIQCGAGQLPLQGITQRPAEGEIGRVQVESDADVNAGPLPHLIRQARGSERPGGDLKHQHLLRQHLGQLARRDAELLQRDVESVEVIAGEILGFQTKPANPVAFEDAPGVPGRLWFVRVLAEEAVADRIQRGPETEMGVETDDGDGGC